MLDFKSRLPWPLSFSFARAIQQPALEIWRGEESHVLAAQEALYHRASAIGLRALANTMPRWRDMSITTSIPRLTIFADSDSKRRRIKLGAGQPEAFGSDRVEAQGG